MPYRCFPRLSLLFTCLFGFASTANGQVELERVFPPAVTAGATTSVKGEGKFPKWPVTVLCDREDVVVTCGEKAGDFQVAVLADAVPGVAWLRMHDELSATNLTPLLVERLAVSTETEPNETVGKANAIAIPAVVVGKLEKNGDVDMWRLPLARGQRLVVQLTAHRLFQSPMDAVLQLVDLRGNVLAQADDDRGLDPQLVYESPDDADVCLRLFAFPETPNSTIGIAGGATFMYALHCTASGFVDHFLPFDDVPVEKLQPLAFGWNLPNECTIHRSPATTISPLRLTVDDCLGWQWQGALSAEAMSFRFDEQLVGSDELLSVPLRVYGHIAQPNEVDRIRIDAKAGTTYRAQVVSRSFGFQLDSVLRVLKGDGSELARNDDVERGKYDAAVDFKPEQDGPLVIEISDLASAGSLRHAYSLHVAASEPSVSMVVDADHFKIESGKSIEVAVAVKRSGGYAKQLELTAIDLPPGVTAEKIVSEPKGETAKSVKLKLTAAADAAPFQGPIQIVATNTEDQTSLVAQYLLRDQFLISKFWLTVSLSNK